jgi:hypothetical protein
MPRSRDFVLAFVTLLWPKLIHLSAWLFKYLLSISHSDISTL